MLSDKPSIPEYFLWRLMIDARYQKFGFGRRALELLFDHVRARPGAKEIFTSCVPGEDGPYGFYERLGFLTTGEMEGNEVVMRREL